MASKGTGDHLLNDNPNALQKPAQPKAIYAALNGQASTPEARECVAGLLEGLRNHEAITTKRVNGRSTKTKAKDSIVLEGLLTDLLYAAGQPSANGWVFRSMRTASFNGDPFSIKVFRPVVRMLTELGFIEAHEENVIQSSAKTNASRWKASKPLLRLLSVSGITKYNVLHHFTQPLPERPLVLRAPSTRLNRDKTKGKILTYVETDQTRAIENEIISLNAFMAGHPITGGSHSGYRRIFNNGTVNDYHWNKGGRLYSICHDSYQSMDKRRRPRMTIAGSSTSEIDVRASYLTVLHGLMGMPFDVESDPYDISSMIASPHGPDLTRKAVKAWAVVTLGNGKHIKSWPVDTAQAFEAGTGLALRSSFPINTVRQSMIDKHPVLAGWGGTGISWADLMFHESQAMLSAMITLMNENNAPSLSVHDSLIVRAMDVDKAKVALASGYKSVCGIDPFLVIKTESPANSIIAP